MCILLIQNQPKSSIYTSNNPYRNFSSEPNKSLSTFDSSNNHPILQTVSNSSNARNKHFKSPGNLSSPKSQSLNWSNLQAGNSHSCLITPLNGILRCWGANNRSQTDTPQALKRQTHQASLGHDFTCGISHHNQIHCFGWNAYGQCDSIQGDELSNIQTKIDNMKKTEMYSDQWTEYEHWAQNPQTNQDQQKNGAKSNDYQSNIHNNNQDNSDDIDDQTSIQSFYKSLNELQAEIISTGFDHACSISKSGTLRCWGGNEHSQSTPASLPEHDPAMPVRACAVTLGQKQTCINDMDDHGSMHCWGINDYGQSDVPNHMIKGVLHISAKYAHTCAISYQNNADNQQFKPTHSKQSQKMEFKEKSKQNIFTKIFRKSNSNSQIENMNESTSSESTSEYKNPPRTNSQTQLECWGSNENGQTTVPGVVRSGVRSVAAGGGHTCAVALGGRLACWGAGAAGQAAVPHAFRHAPRAVALGMRHSLAIDRESHMHCWGSKDHGQCQMPSDFNQEFNSNIIEDQIDNTKDKDYQTNIIQYWDNQQKRNIMSTEKDGNQMLDVDQFQNQKENREKIEFAQDFTYNSDIDDEDSEVSYQPRKSFETESTIPRESIETDDSFKEFSENLKKFEKTFSDNSMSSQN